MTARQERLRQGAQLRGPGYSIGYISTTFQPENSASPLAARLGISDGTDRQSAELSLGDTAPLPGGGSIRLIDIAVSPDGSQQAALLEITDAAATKK